MTVNISDLSGDGIAADVAVIGGGVAGQTIAKALADRGREVLLVESGGADFDPVVQRLAEGENAGLDYYPLDHARLRFFGGTAAIWGGRSCRLDPIDFEKREWVPMSGWPFAAGALAPYYTAAEKMLGIAVESGGDDWRERASLDPALVSSRLWRFDTQGDRFTLARRGDITSHPRIRVLSHATATQLALAPGGDAVESVTVAGLDGARREIKSRHVVVACGGIENARLLLLSDDVTPGGIGNTRDWVGRCFMEHMHGRGATISSSCPEKLLRLTTFFEQGGVLSMHSLTPSEAVQRATCGLNTSFTIAAVKSRGSRPAIMNRCFNYARANFAPPQRRWRGGFNALRDLSRAAQLRLDPWRPGALVRTGFREIAMILRAEQAPNPDSRVTLSQMRDALGLRGTKLDWRLTELDKHGARVAVDALGEALCGSGLGNLRREGWLDEFGTPWEFDEAIGRHWIGGYHHMGTTRMADDPADGVCDGFGRVHGVANLTITGSSLFPTSGWANPTLTIMALALRQAEHIARQR